MDDVKPDITRRLRPVEAPILAFYGRTDDLTAFGPQANERFFFQPYGRPDGLLCLTISTPGGTGIAVAFPGDAVVMASTEYFIVIPGAVVERFVEDPMFGDGRG